MEFTVMSAPTSVTWHSRQQPVNLPTERHEYRMHVRQVAVEKELINLPPGCE